jgi:hypothetical protein
MSNPPHWQTYDSSAAFDLKPAIGFCPRVSRGLQSGGAGSSLASLARSEAGCGTNFFQAVSGRPVRSAGANQHFANHRCALPAALTNLKIVAVKVAIEQSLGGEI